MFQWRFSSLLQLEWLPHHQSKQDSTKDRDDARAEDEGRSFTSHTMTRAVFLFSQVGREKEVAIAIAVMGRF